MAQRPIVIPHLAVRDPLGGHHIMGDKAASMKPSADYASGICVDCCSIVGDTFCPMMTPGAATFGSRFQLLVSRRRARRRWPT